MPISFVFCQQKGSVISLSFINWHRISVDVFFGWHPQLKRFLFSCHLISFLAALWEQTLPSFKSNKVETVYLICIPALCYLLLRSYVWIKSCLTAQHLVWQLTSFVVYDSLWWTTVRHSSRSLVGCHLGDNLLNFGLNHSSLSSILFAAEEWKFAVPCRRVFQGILRLI